MQELSYLLCILLKFIQKKNTRIIRKACRNDVLSRLDWRVEIKNYNNYAFKWNVSCAKRTKGTYFNVQNTIRRKRKTPKMIITHVYIKTYVYFVERYRWCLSDIIIYSLIVGDDDDRAGQCRCSGPGPRVTFFKNNNNKNDIVDWSIKRVGAWPIKNQELIRFIFIVFNIKILKKIVIRLKQ